MIICMLLGFGGCEKGRPEDPNADAQGHTPATTKTTEVNQEVEKELPFSDEQDFMDSRRGLIAADPNLRIKNRENGNRMGPKRLPVH